MTGRIMPIIALTLTMAACQHGPRVSPWQSVAVDAPPPALVLLQAPADGPGVITGLVEALEALEGRKGAARVLLATANSWDDATLERSAGARLLVAHAVFEAVQAGVLGKRFTEVRDVVDRMVRVAPKAPETRFALAYLRWILVADGRGSLAKRGLTDAVLRDLLGNLDALVREHPAFDGPGDFDRARIRRERDAVQQLIAGLPGAATPVR